MILRGLFLAMFVALCSAPVLMADQFQITAGISGPVNGLCATKCSNSPNLLTPSDVGLYLSSSKSATEELLVLFVPDDTTNLFPSDPIMSVKVYNTTPALTPTNVTGTSAFATPSNAKSLFGLGTGSQNYVAGGFWGTIDSDKASVKVGKLLGLGFGGGLNMKTVSEDSELFSHSGTNEFGIYTFLINGVFHGDQLLDLQFSTALPEGTFVAALTNTGLSTSESSSGVVDAPRGAAPTVPEPLSVLLLGTVLLGFGIRTRGGGARRVASRRAY